MLYPNMRFDPSLNNHFKRTLALVIFHLRGQDDGDADKQLQLHGRSPL